MTPSLPQLQQNGSNLDVLAAAYERLVQGLKTGRAYFLASGVRTSIPGSRAKPLIVSIHGTLTADGSAEEKAKELATAGILDKAQVDALVMGFRDSRELRGRLNLR